MTRPSLPLLLVLAVASACSDTETAPPAPPAASSSGGPTVDDAGGGGFTPPGERLAALDLGFRCARPYRVDARWTAFPGADRYVAELADGTRLAETRETQLRIRQDDLRAFSITALAGERRLAAASFGQGGRWSGDLVWLRGRRGAETTLEMVGCFAERLAAGVFSPLPSEINAMRFPGEAPTTLRQSASVVELEPYVRSRLLFRGGEDTYVVDSAHSFLTADQFGSVRVRAWDGRTSAVVTTASGDAVIDEAGDVRVGPHDGELEVWGAAAELEPRVARSLSVDASGGVWIVASGPDAGALFRRADLASTLESIALPEGVDGSASSFDAASRSFADHTSGRIFQLEGEGAASTWRDTGLVVPGVRSIRSAEGYVFLTGGTDGNELVVLEPATYAVRGRYTLDGVTDLELVGYEPRRELPIP